MWRVDEMTRETIKEYILQVKSQDGTEALYNRWEPDILVEVINEIFNYHEAQLKTKDEEIKELGEIVQQYLIPSKNYDAIIKAKDEEIERLKEHITHLQNVYMKLDGKYLKLKTELEELKDDK